VFTEKEIKKTQNTMIPYLRALWKIDLNFKQPPC